MEGLLHPVGPEDVRTYWIRRGGAIAVLLVLMIGLGLIISNLGGADGNATQAETTAAPAPPAEAADPAIAEAPPPAPPGGGGPNEITNAEAVPVPSSARSAKPASKRASQVDERSADDADESPRPDGKPEPEPSNTFHLSAAATPSPTW